MARTTKGQSGLTTEDWWRAMRWQMAKETGWSLEYIDGLTWGDVWEYVQVADANAKYNAQLQRQAQQRNNRGKGRRRR